MSDELTKSARQYALNLIQETMQQDDSYRQAVENMSVDEIEVAIQYYMAVYLGSQK